MKLDVVDVDRAAEAVAHGLGDAVAVAVDVDQRRREDERQDDGEGEQGQNELNTGAAAGGLGVRGHLEDCKGSELAGVSVAQDVGGCHPAEPTRDDRAVTDGAPNVHFVTCSSG